MSDFDRDFRVFIRWMFFAAISWGFVALLILLLIMKVVFQWTT